MNHQPMPHSLQATDHQGHGLRVRFWWQGDRYAHAIDAIADDVLPVLASSAGDGDPDWPDDPPLQQLSIEPAGAFLAALGVGQAGRSHWSISVEARPGAAPSLRFDVACRCTDPPPQALGSRYRDLLDGRRRSIAVDHAQWPLDGALVCLQVDHAVGPARLTASDVADRDRPATLRIAADVSDDRSAAEHGGRPRTVRWGFTITWQRESPA